MQINKIYVLFLLLLPSLSFAASGTSENFLQDLERVLGSAIPTSTGSTASSVSPIMSPEKINPDSSSATWSKSQTKPLIGIDLSSAPPAPNTEMQTCSLPAIVKIYVREEWGVSDLRWPSIKWASGYNLYKKIQDWSWILVEALIEPAYRIHLAPWVVIYQDFAVRALCATNKESTNISGATSVQTWPAVWIFVLFSLLAGGYISYRYFNARNSTEIL